MTMKRAQNRKEKKILKTNTVLCCIPCYNGGLGGLLQILVLRSSAIRANYSAIR